MLQFAAPLPVLRREAYALAVGMPTGFAADSGGELKVIPSYVHSPPGI
jgi:hypothetical protein